MQWRVKQWVWKMKQPVECPCFRCGRTTDVSGLLCDDPRCDVAAANAQAMLAIEVLACQAKPKKLRYTQTRAAAGAWQLL